MRILGVVTVVALLAGCSSAMDRAAMLACKNDGGVKSYSPQSKALVVVCKGGVTHTIEWLP